MKTLLIILLLIPSLCHAGPAARRFMMVANDGIFTSINGISSISDAGTTDTGTESITMAAGTIQVDAACGSEFDTASVMLVVDGVERDSFVCVADTLSGTLAYTVAAGSHSVRVYGLVVPPLYGTFSANNFRISVP